MNAPPDGLPTAPPHRAAGAASPTPGEGLTGWINAWWGRLSASPLSLWGKVPSHGDYVRLQVGSAEAAQWTRWLSLHAPSLGPGRAAAQRDRAGAGGWLRLDASSGAERALVPVAFVLSPGTLAFSGSRYVMGVIARSRDKVGRAHPLVAYQTVRPSWLHACARAPDLGWWFGMAQLLERWLWLAELERGEGGPATPAGTGRHGSGADWAALCALAQAQGALQRPPGLALLNARRAQPSQPLSHAMRAGELQQWLAQQLPAPPDLDEDFAGRALASHRFEGVRHMPWTDWPARVMGPGAGTRAAFWQQNHHGRFIAVGDSLAQVLPPRGSLS